MEFLLEYHRVIMGLHLLALALGLGGATVSDVMFFRFTKDARISAKELSVMRTLSGVIWAGIGLLILSGLGMYLPSWEAYNAMPKFVLKMLVALIIVLNGIMLNVVITPYLDKIAFGKGSLTQTQKIQRLRKLTFASGALSVTSWYSAFILGLMPGSLDYSFATLLTAYIVLVLGAVAVSQVMAYVLARK